MGIKGQEVLETNPENTASCKTIVSFTADTEKAISDTPHYQVPYPVLHSAALVKVWLQMQVSNYS